MLGIASFILALYSQTLYSERNNVLYFRITYVGVDCDYKLMDSTDCWVLINHFQKQERCLKKKYIKIKT